ncbi:hypothetical protein SAMN05444164_0643 [Bradyrhizobium erythrophlei]|uniref:Uncharacterized protein n=1 Tax=Bradyrhizobium erythrophlei TaxID=1437360 RepID=A0A1H4NKR4_9BRAD|nr:hypothetical protein SAMN05444164_0643 [Bradyrhizobium erythrophlei]
MRLTVLLFARARLKLALWSILLARKLATIGSGMLS